MSRLLRDLALDLGRFEREFYDRGWFERRGLGDAWFFPKEAFGRDALVRETEEAAGWVPRAPLGERAKADLIRVIDDPPDYLAGRGRAEKLELLSGITYRGFLLDVAKVDPQLVQVYQESTTAYFGVGIDATTALDAWGNWNPGFAGMDLGERPYRTMSPSGRLALTDPDPYIYHFPDGNHGVARALVRALVPAALPGSTMEELATADVAYGALDDPASPVRLRLNATAVRVRHEGEGVSVQYVAHGGGRHLREVTAGHVVLACWHAAIPYLTDEIGDAQRAALLDQKKVPLIYTNVQVRSWEAFDRLKIKGFTAPGHFWRGAGIDFPVSMGSYRFADKPEDPVVLHLAKVPVKPGLPSREQAKAGRAWVASTPFEEMERQVRDLLARALGEGGFDPARDVEGITVNRWAHGYAYEYMRPWDAFWPDGPLPIETARKGWGRVAVANADSGAYAYAHGAIDQAVRAVRELLGAPEGAPAHAGFPGPPREAIGL